MTQGQPVSGFVEGSPVRAGREHFAVLDGLRGVAALAVLLGHASALILGHTLIERKLLAVEFFFMLSGFVVAYAYEARLKAEMKAGEFVLRRVIRLYPMICIAVVCGIVVDRLHGQAAFSPARTLSFGALGVVAIPNPIHLMHGQAFPLDPPEWSVFYEMLVSVVFGLSLFRASSRALLGLVAVTSSALVTVMVVYGDGVPFALHVFGAFATFAGGMLLCRLFLSGAAPVIRIPSPVLAVLLVAVCATPRSVGAWVDVVTVILLFPLIVLSGAQAKPSSRRLDGWIGELSYPLYILHWPVLTVAKDVLAPRLGSVAAIGLGSVASIGAAWTAYVVIDKPVRRALSRRLVPPPVGHAASSGAPSRITPQAARPGQ